MKWSSEQLDAITKDGTNILVSAGAGSGKTAVLTERIVRLVEKGTPINRFLVMTFTKAAAAEMKQRIRDKISHIDSLKEQLSLIDESHIETFDAFAFWVVKKYGYRLQIDKNIDIIEKSIFTVEYRKLIDKTFERLYKEKDQGVIDLIHAFCIKNTNNVKDIVQNAIDLACKKENKYQFLQNLTTYYFTNDFISSCLKEAYQKCIDLVKTLRAQSEELENIDDANALCDYFDGILSLRDYQELYDFLSSHSLPNKPSKGYSEEGSKERDLIRKKYSNSTKNILSYGTLQIIQDRQLANQKYVETIVKIAVEVEQQMDKFRFEHKSYSFSDIALLCTSLLGIEEVRNEVKNMFDYILIDEYQDTNDIQESVIQKLGKNNVYMVGDVKQSIYRFRNANCEIFNDKYEEYKKKNGGIEIDLNTSFRSRSQIVNLINDMFSKLMTKQNNIIDYDNGHHFKYGQTKYDSNFDSRENYDLEIFIYNDEKKVNKIEVESNLVADDIISKINREMLVFDKDSGSMRKASFKDFAIILDRSTKYDEISRVFGERNIPLRIINDAAIKSLDITKVVKNLVKLINLYAKHEENVEFKHAFISVARSFLIQMKDDEIYHLFASNDGLYKTSELYKKIGEIASTINSSSLVDIIKSIYSTFDIYQAIITIGDYLFHSRVCDKFLTFAESMSKLEYSLDDFVEYFNMLDKFDLDIPFSLTPQTDDAVTLINIHKSKGLEYPFCYFLGMSYSFNRNSNHSSFLISSDYGVCLPVIDSNGGDESLFIHLLRQKDIAEDFEEKLRLFYVALTRAREKIIITCPVSSLTKPIDDIKNASSLISFINVLNLAQRCGVTKTIVNDKLDLSYLEPQGYDIEICEIETEHVPIEKHRISKRADSDIDVSLLDFGTLMHFLIESVDFDTKDTSFIDDKQYRKYIDNILNCPLFKGVSNNHIIREYEFYDEATNLHGVIDCLVIHSDHIDIIDFKLKNISDEEYELQLKTYRDYVATLSTLPIRTFLLSIVDGAYREIKN